MTEVNAELEPRYTRRLADRFAISFYKACKVGNLCAAEYLMLALEREVACSTDRAGADQREDGNEVAAVHTRFEQEVHRNEDLLLDGLYH